MNYKKNHYEELMKGKVKEKDMLSIVNENLELMDNLLSVRKVNVSEKAATKSEEALIAYINQSKYSRWVINNYAHLSAADRLVFIKGMNEVLPYVADREIFISHIKFSMKENLCRNLALDCWLEDLMNSEQESCILTQKGFEHFKKKYKKEIEVMLNGIAKQAEEEEIEEERRIDEYLQNAKNTDLICTKLDENENLPFS